MFFKRKLLRRMLYSQDFDCVFLYPVNDDVMWMHNHFPRAVLTTCPVKVRAFAELFGLAKNKVGQLLSSGLVFFGNMLDNF